MFHARFCARVAMVADGQKLNGVKFCARVGAGSQNNI